MTPVDPFTGVIKRAPMEPHRIHPDIPKSKPTTKQQQADLAEAEHEARRNADAREIWAELWCGD